MLPSKLKFANRVESSFARNFQSVINPQNTSNAGLGQTTIINLPTMQNQFTSGMDCLFNYTLNLRNSSGADSTRATLNKCGGHGAIQRIRVFHGSSLMDDLDDYGTIMSALIPFQHDSDYLSGKGKLLSGTDLQRGVRLGVANNGVIANNAEHSRTFSLSLMTILSLCNTYVPMYALTSAPIRLEIQWVNSIAKFVNSNVVLSQPTTATALFSDIKFIMNVVELSDQGMAIVRGQSGEAVQWSVQSFSNYQHNVALTAGVDQVSMAIPAKFNSLKALYFTFRENSGGALERFADDSASFSLAEYSTRIGSNVIPSQKPQSTVEFLSEAHRALGSVGSRNEPHSYVASQYEAIVSNENGGQSGAFLVGVETESYSSVDMSQTYQGLNTSTSDIFGQFTFAPASGAKNIRIDCFASYDKLITIQNGVAIVQF